MADLSSEQAAQTVKIVGSDSSGNEQTPVTSTANGGLHSNLRDATGTELGTQASPLAINGNGTAGTPNAGVITAQGIQSGVPFKAVPVAPYASGSYPDPSQAYPDSNAQQLQNNFNLNADNYGNLQTRGPVITDEVSSRNDFIGASLLTTLTGTVRFASNSTEVTGVGTAFTTEVKSGWYLKRSAGADTEFVQVDYVESDTRLFLVANYSGNYNNVAFQQTEYKPTTVGGASYNVAASLLNLVSSTANGNSVAIENQGDYLPFNLQFMASISQRIANQTAFIGFRDNLSAPNFQANIVFDGTTNTTVKFITSGSSSANDTQTTTVTLPAGAVTSAINVYQIDLIGPQCCLLINGVLVATHTNHLPGPYNNLKACSGISNQAVVTTTTLAIDYLYFSNQNRLNIGNDFQSDPLSVVMYGRDPSSGIREVAVGEIGEVYTTDVQNKRASYSASIIGLVPAANPTDIFTLTGSATKTIKISKVKLTATQTTAAVRDVALLRRSTANTGGTSTTPAAVSMDTNSAAATAVARAYTVNPTLGTLVGNISASKILIPTTTGQPTPLDYKAGDGNQFITLRGINQVFAVNLNAVSSAGGSFDLAIEWTEE